MTLPARSDPPASPGVHFPPPLLFVAGLLLGWLLESRIARLRLIGEATSPEPLWGFGILIAAIGAGLAAWGIATFHRARTGVFPNQPATGVVATGPYRLTRNPMYVGMTLVYIGMAFLADMGWPLLLLPVVLTALQLLVIRREERYLKSAFGVEYEAYCRRVRRWI